MSETLKNPYEENHFLVKRRLEAYNSAKKNSFVDIFQRILLRYKAFAFHVQNSKSTYYVGHVSMAASEQELK